MEAGLTITAANENGTPGSETASFNIDDRYIRATSSCIDNAAGGTADMVDDDCGGNIVSLEIGPGDLVDQVTKLPLNLGCSIVKIAVINPADAPSVSNTGVTMLVDINLPVGVDVAPDHTLTVTLSFDPTGWDNRAEFESNLQIFHLNDLNQWEVIARGSNGTAVVNWDNATIQFESDDFSAFTASSRQNTPETSGDSGGGDDTETLSGRGCSVAKSSHNMSIGSVLANISILLLPLFIFGIKRKIGLKSRKEKA